MSKARIKLGAQGEDLAADYLTTQGYIILARNFRKKSGEIDIIARDGEWLVFIEVKTRTNLLFGQPYEAVTLKKQAQISRGALAYITINKLHNQAMRFDVISVLIQTNGKTEINHLPGCFEAAL
jgi:putative endonuclease